jgi:hypothetical protein
MNTIVQNILVIITGLLAVLFLVNKFFWKKPKSKKGCGDDDCGCH